MLSIFNTILTNPGFATVLKYIFYTAPVWLTFLLAVTGWHLWLTYRRAKFIAEQKYTLLEIKLPKEIFKSPQAIEFLYNALWAPFGEATFDIKWDRWPPKISNEFYWKGSVRPWYSLELCAIDGKV